MSCNRFVDEVLLRLLLEDDLLDDKTNRDFGLFLLLEFMVMESTIAPATESHNRSDGLL